MNILRIIARLNVGGPARHVILVDRGLTGRGHDTFLVHGSVGPGEASLEHLAEVGPIRTAKLPELGRRIHPLDDLRALIKLTAIIFRHKPDIVHTHTAKAGALGRLAACFYNLTRGRASRAAVIHTFHGHVLDGYFRPSVNVLVRFAERALARATDRIVTISPQQHYDITRRYRIASSAKTVTIPLGLDLAPLFELPADAPNYRNQLGIGAGEAVVGFVGRFAPIKDVPALIRAFALARERQPNLWLLLAGDGEERPEIERLAAQLHVTDRVRLLGWVEDLPRLYATLDLCALSSRNEGTPVAIIEAMAAGKPVAATAVGGVIDIVQDGETGLLVPTGEIDAFANALHTLASNPTRRAQMGAAARRSVIDRYSIDRLVSDVEALYGVALTDRRGVPVPAHSR